MHFAGDLGHSSLVNLRFRPFFIIIIIKLLLEQLV